MRQEERLSLRQRFQFRCGYCGVRERDVGAELTVDHFHPGSKGGADDPENWVYCCHACNEFKGNYWQPDSARRILHPFRDDLTIHYVERDDGALQGLSETGTFHIERLHLNRKQLVEHRYERRLLAIATALEERQLAEVAALEGEVELKSTELGELRGDSEEF